MGNILRILLWLAVLATTALSYADSTGSAGPLESWLHPGRLGKAGTTANAEAAVRMAPEDNPRIKP